jgi:hemerythrin-like domain-containing protein
MVKSCIDRPFHDTLGTTRWYFEVGYRNGDETALADITAHLKTLTEFYPRHIEKEDKEFFPSSRTYFTDEEDQAMLVEFWEFDRNMIHEKYKSLVEGFEGR